MNNYTITSTKSQKSTPTSVLFCAICGKELSAETAAAGPYDADGELALICNHHLQSTRELINLLADFIVSEHLLFGQNKNKNNTRKIVPDAWFLH